MLLLLLLLLLSLRDNDKCQPDVTRVRDPPTASWRCHVLAAVVCPNLIATDCSPEPPTLELRTLAVIPVIQKNLQWLFACHL